jgi:hypothetical protein
MAIDLSWLLSTKEVCDLIVRLEYVERVSGESEKTTETMGELEEILFERTGSRFVPRHLRYAQPTQPRKLRRPGRDCNKAFGPSPQNLVAGGL